MTEPKLKPCPFCGGEAKVMRIFGHETVACTVCDACILLTPYDTEHEPDVAIKLWNRRTEKQPQTNFQRITQNPEALAEFIWQDRVEQSDWWYEQCGHTVEEVLEWLKQESE